ncbi:MAG: hypothetical protein V7K97_13285 [Nostoc sp.]|uniref:hypothetical protein n=1 Tax=Nostoc sp. TaxID=1180 RepID=UPI002FFB46FC
MSYSDFSLSKVKRDFNLTTVENGRFLPEIQFIEPSIYLKEALSEGRYRYTISSSTIRN